MKNSVILTAALAGALNSVVPHMSHAGEELLHVEDITYLGAFRISDGRYGESKTGWSRGQIAISPGTNTFFMGGGDIYSLAEFSIPDLIISDNINDLNYTGAPVQNYVKILDKAGVQNSQNLNVMTGLKLIDGKLIINGIEEYNAAADNDDTTIIVDNPFDLQNSTLSGFKKLNGRAHAAGWLAPIPEGYQAALGGDYISGYSSVYSINGRFSIGPTAFVVDIADFDLTADGGTIPATAVLDYSIDNPITEKSQFNYVDGVIQDNDLWTETSSAVFGMIVPGTSTYFTLGGTSGHRTGIGYKIVQEDTGKLCGGSCPFYASDTDNYAWLYDVADLISVKDGAVLPHSVQPYAYGKMNLALEDADNDGEIATISSADYDYVNNVLYIVYHRGDLVQAQFSPNALVLAYQFKLASTSPGMCVVR